MKLKLYDGAWVELARYGPQVLAVECTERRLYRTLTFVYQEDGRPAPGFGEAPRILLIYSRGCFRFRAA
jgi:hypothetical protein